jgi:hypothetical protein
MEALLGGSISLYSLLTMRVAEQPLELDTDAIARELEYQVGERITQVTNTIKREVGRRIVAWYNSPGMPMQTIINQLRPAFGINRAALIATTEITDLHSRVQDRIMADVGLDEWWVNTKRDQLVCTRQIEGPDGQIYQGCRALHGKRFKRGQKMPPFHCNCRCSSVIAVIKPTTPTETPIIDTSHLVKADFVEGEHPRDKGGEFTSKGGEGAGGKMEKPVKVVRSEKKEDYISGDSAIDIISKHEFPQVDIVTENAIVNYQTTDSHDINFMLRKENYKPREDKAVVKKMISSLTKYIDNCSLTENITAYRGIRTKDLPKGLMPGDKFIDKGFVSTTLDKSWAAAWRHDEGGNAVFEIELDKGTKATYIPSVTAERMKNYSNGEKELLLQRGTEFIVKEIGKKSYIDKYGNKGNKTFVRLGISQQGIGV